jgi:hypothetical protein
VELQVEQEPAELGQPELARAQEEASAARADAAAQRAEASAAREAKEAATRQRLKAGELGLDIYNMRDALAKKGLRYVDAEG